MFIMTRRCSPRGLRLDVVSPWLHAPVGWRFVADGDNPTVARHAIAVLDVDGRTGQGGMQRTGLVILHVEKPR
jgi:hypothetical protein